MKQTLTTILALCTVGLISVGLFSCRKDQDQVDIKTFDDQQIQNYIKVHNLTGYVRDAGDTTGIYYKVTRQGSGKPLTAADEIFYVYTQTAVDGSVTQSDTILNHAYNYIGHITPTGIQLAILNMLKYRGTQAHVLIPSRLAYGTTGTGIGSNKLGGNQSLDVYLNLVDPAYQDTYDDISIQAYMKANNLSGYTKTASGLYYKVTQQGTGTVKVTPSSQVGVQFTGKLFNGTMFDDYNAADTTASVRDYTVIPKGWQEGFQYVTKGAKLSLIVPSKLAYGLEPAKQPAAYYGFSVLTPLPNSCLYYDFNIESITNP